jgi:hypothetical protein
MRTPHALLIGLFVVAAAFSVAVSNTATALILIPVAVSAADTLDISARPVLMSVAVGCSAAFLDDHGGRRAIALATTGGSGCRCWAVLRRGGVVGAGDLAVLIANGNQRPHRACHVTLRFPGCRGMH